MKRQSSTPPRYVNPLNGTCAATGKRIYASEYDAINAAVELSWAPTVRDLKPHFCIYCMRWHLTRKHRE